jgi:hypothetical protein
MTLLECWLTLNEEAISYGGWRTLPHHLDARFGFSGCPVLRASVSCEGWGLRRMLRQPFRRTPTSRAGPTLQRLSACAE